MDRFRQMQVFVAVAEEEGFAAAARRLQMSPPAVTRMVASLEETLGVKLLNRTTRYVRVTEAGQRYLEDSRRILTEIEAADDAAAGINAEPRGHLTITAPVMFGRLYVMPVVLEYLRLYPEMEVEMVLLDRVVNLMEEGIDLGVRIGELPDSSMRALKVGSVRQVLVASPDYLSSRGKPAHPKELPQHTVVTPQAGSMHSTAAGNWRFFDGREEVQVQVKPRLKVTTNDAAIAAAIDGFGITRVLSYQVANRVAQKELEYVLAEYEPPSPARPYPAPARPLFFEQSARVYRPVIGTFTGRLIAEVVDPDTAACADQRLWVSER